MAAQGFLLLASYLLVLLVLARPLGMCLARMVNDIPLPGLAGVERVLWRVAGIRAEEMGWLQYLLAILLFNALGGLALFALLMLQGVLPFNPQHLPGLSWDLALNTAISFVSNTNWQAYAGESTMSYLSQMVGLTVQNFLSAATGIAVVFALTRAFARQKMSTLGNAWVDLTRITLWLLLPLSLLVALFFIQQGVPQNLQAYQPFTTLEGVHQLLPMGPVASQEAIKLLGTNGGGFFNANSAHPFENPTADQSRADAGDLPDPGGAVLRLRRGGKRSASGTRHPVGNDADLYTLRRRGDVGGDPRQSASADAGCRQQPEYGR